MQGSSAEATIDGSFSIYTKHYTPNNPEKYIAGLDGLRAISVGFVVFAHAGFGSVIPGGLGVTIFFFISGFLITNILVSEWVSESKIGIKKFYIRRYLRLSPELFFYITIGTIINFITSSPRIIDSISGYLYFNNYLNIFNENSSFAYFYFSHFWSLAVEEHFYLITPLLMLLFGRQLSQYIWLIIAICAVAPFYRWFASIHFVPEHLIGGASAYTYYASEARLDSLFWGCLLAMISRFSSFLPPLVKRHAFALLLTAIALLLISLLVRDYHFRSVWKYSIQGASLFIAFSVLYFSNIGARAMAILENGVFRYVGRVSYGVYIWHLVPIAIIGVYFGGDSASGSMLYKLSCAIASMTISTAIASLSAVFILKPLNQLRKQFGSSLMREV